MPACNVLFWNQVNPSESIYRPCALAFDFLTLRRAHSFCPSVHSLWLSILSVSVPSFTNLVGIKMVAAFVIEQEVFTQRVFHEKEPPLQMGRTLQVHF
jgi:hypothetical protein